MRVGAAQGARRDDGSLASGNDALLEVHPNLRDEVGGQTGLLAEFIYGNGERAVLRILGDVGRYGYDRDLAGEVAGLKAPVCSRSSNTFGRRGGSARN